MVPDTPVEQGGPSEPGARLDELFRAYRAACPDPGPGANFMPDIWARIETREVSANWFGRVAKTLVIAALAVSAILAMMIPSANRSSSAFFDAAFVEALQVDPASNPEPLNLDRISELESRRPSKELAAQRTPSGRQAARVSPWVWRRGPRACAASIRTGQERFTRCTYNYSDSVHQTCLSHESTLLFSIAFFMLIFPISALSK